MKDAKIRINICKQPNQREVHWPTHPGRNTPSKVIGAQNRIHNLARDAPAFDLPLTVDRVSRVVELATPIV